MSKFLERTYPYWIALCVTVIWYFYGYDLSESIGYNYALDSTSIMCSILLGFIAAIFPVVLSLQTKNNYIDKVIKNGGNLLRSYCVENIICGFVLILINISNYFRFDTRLLIKTILFYCWVLFVVMFIFCSIRSVYFLLRMIMPKEIITRVPEESVAEKQYKNKY